MENPYTRLISVMKSAGEQKMTPLRIGEVCGVSPLKVAVAGNVCDNEIAGCAQGYNPEIGDEVLIANVDNTDNDYIIICKVV